MAGPYAVYADLVARLDTRLIAQLSRDDDAATPVDLGVVTALLQAASDELYAALRFYYTDVQLLAAPLAKEWTCTITIYGLYRRRPPVSEAVKALYTEVLGKFADVATGRLVLDWPGEVLVGEGFDELEDSYDDSGLFTGLRHDYQSPREP